MSEPTYLKLLNGISRAESSAHQYLNGWIEVTDNPAVKAVLKTISVREGEHGLAFAKRISELGYELEVKEDPRSDNLCAIATSDMSDLEKFRAMGLDRVEQDVLGYFDTAFADHTIDIQTGALLGRYIAEEHDTARRFRACYEALVACEESGAADDGRVDARIDSLAEQVDSLCQAVEDLHQIVVAQARPGTNDKATNGKAVTSAKRTAH